VNAPRAVRFHEVMKGRIAAATAPGNDTGIASTVLEADVAIDDLDAFLVDPNRRARLSGEVRIEGKGTFPAAGKVELFVVGDRPGHRLMRYEATFTIASSQHRLVGTKHVGRASGVFVWRDVTTLYTTIWRLDAPAVATAAGVLKLSLWQGIRLLLSLRGSGIGAILRFARFFLADSLAAAVGWPR
jgi:hypothetical protein